MIKTLEVDTWNDNCKNVQLFGIISCGKSMEALYDTTCSDPNMKRSSTKSNSNTFSPHTHKTSPLESETLVTVRRPPEM